MIDFETKKVLFIDLDGTLIKTISGKTKYLCSIDTSLVFGRPDICFYFKK